jgi:hypothetical protein
LGASWQQCGSVATRPWPVVFYGPAKGRTRPEAPSGLSGRHKPLQRLSGCGRRRADRAAVLAAGPRQRPAAAPRRPLPQAQRGGTQLGSSGADAIDAMSHQHIHIWHCFRGLTQLFARPGTAAMCSAAQRRGAPRRRVADPVCRQLGKAELPLCMCLMTADHRIGRQLCPGRNRHSRLPQQWSAGVMAGAARHAGAAAHGAHQARPDSGATRSRCFAALCILPTQHSALSQQKESIRRAVW